VLKTFLLWGPQGRSCRGASASLNTALCESSYGCIEQSRDWPVEKQSSSAQEPVRRNHAGSWSNPVAVAGNLKYMVVRRIKCIDVVEKYR